MDGGHDDQFSDGDKAEIADDGRGHDGLLLLLTRRLTDGANAGRLHVYDGGTRALAKGATLITPSGVERTLEDKLPAVDPEYQFRCVIDDMTEIDAAKQFTVCNGLSVRPSQLDQYRVGLVEGAVDAHAVQKALDSLGLEARHSQATYGNGEPGNVGAIAACYRIVNEGRKMAQAAGVEDEGDQWDLGAWHLAAALRVARRAYRSAEAHDADLIQAVARLIRLNPELADHTHKNHLRWVDRLVRTIGLQPVQDWRAASVLDRDKAAMFAGSSSRASHMSRVIARRANARQRQTQWIMADQA